MNPTVTANPPAPDLPDLCHSLMERSPVPMAELEGVGHVMRYVNPAFCRLVGKSKEALIGKPFADTVQEGDGCLALLERVSRTGEAETHTESAHPEPHPAYWSYAMWPVLDAAQRPVGVMVQVTETTPFHQQTVAMNEALLRSAVRQHELTEAAEKLNEQLQAEITERKQAEAALRQAKEAAAAADRTKSEFLATMSHELRTPLNVILGYTDMLLGNGVGRITERQADTLRRIDKNARTLFELISMVLDMNRLEIGRLPVEVKAVGVPELLAEIQVETQWVREQSGLAFGWAVTGSLPTLQTDPGKLKVVLKNLISNAVKYTPQGSVTVAAQAQNGGVTISVADTGMGIPVEQQGLIFEAFRQLDTASAQGVGLGLYIVKRLLELLRGTIAVESEVGHGSIFRVWLPTGSTTATVQ